MSEKANRISFEAMPGQCQRIANAGISRGKCQPFATRAQISGELFSGENAAGEIVSRDCPAHVTGHHESSRDVTRYGSVTPTQGRSEIDAARPMERRSYSATPTQDRRTTRRREGTSLIPSPNLGTPARNCAPLPTGDRALSDDPDREAKRLKRMERDAGDLNRSGSWGSLIRMAHRSDIATPDFDAIERALSGDGQMGTDEASLRTEIAARLDAAGIQYARDVTFPKSELIDFVVGRVGVLIELRGSGMTTVERLRHIDPSNRLVGFVVVGRAGLNGHRPSQRPVMVIEV